MKTSKFFRCAAIAVMTTGGMVLAHPASAQVSLASGVDAGELDVPVNKSQVLRADRPYSKALIGNPDIADIVPISGTSVYVLGKKTGTTSLTLYDHANRLIAVVDVVVGPDVTTLKHQLADLLPGDAIAARMSNDSVILEGMVHNAVEADKAVQIAETFAPGKVVNMLSLGSAQQVMLEVRIAEVSRSALTDLGLNHSALNRNGTAVTAIGNTASVPTTTTTTTTSGTGPSAVTSRVSQTVATGAGALSMLLPTTGFGALGIVSHVFGLRLSSTLDALEQKGAVRTLAQPTLVALSGETASFLAGGEFPIPVAQSGTTGSLGSATAISVEFKPFGVSLAFTPTVLADGVINMVVAPEVSSLDSSASVTINGLQIPGLKTRRAKTVVELRDGESFALAGLIQKDFQDTVRQIPLLGSLPILGALFRSTNYQHSQTELVIIVTPRLVRPVPAGSLKAPTDRVGPPNEADLLLNGQTDTGVPPAARPFVTPAPLPPPPPAPAAASLSSAGAKKPVGFEKDYGHVL